MQQRLIQILHYDLWANKKILTHVKNLPEDIFHQEMDSVFPTIAETIYHIFRGQRIWIKRCIPGIEVDETTTAFTDIEQAEKCLTEMNNVLVKAVQDNYDRLDTIEYTTDSGELRTYRFEDIIYHLVNHGSYHRGNIASMIRDSGFAGTSTDYIVFLRDRQ